MKKTKWVLAGGMALCVVGGFGYLKVVNRLPDVQIPTPTMPSPNAFDYFVKAGKAIKDDKAIGNAVSTNPASGQKVYSLAEKEKLVAENSEAISLLHQGFAYPYLNPPARSFYTLFPYYAKFRSVARLLSLKGQTEAANRDYTSATQSWLDAVQIGLMVPRGSGLIGDLVGIACEAIGRKPLWQNVNHLTPNQTKLVLRRLISLEEKRVLYTATLQEEKWAMQAGLIEIFQPNWKPTLDEEDKEAGRTVEQTRLGTQFMTTVIGKGRILNNTTDYMDQCIANASKPYATHLPDPPEPRDPISRIFAPVFKQAGLKAITARTENALLIVALALNAYHEEKGTYPEGLDALVPTYLKELPLDPYALKGTFHYRRQGEKFLLYSVGPDGNDDGGKPIDNPQKASRSNPKARYQPTADSLGDLVVGINTY